MNKGLRVAMTTMGCRSNFADSVELQAALVSEGAIPCDFSSQADVYVINTCTVTDSAEKEVRSLIRSAQKHGQRIVVTGCLATVGSEVFSELGSEDAVVAPGKRIDLLDAILNSERDSEIATETKLPKRRDRHHSNDINYPLSDSLASPTAKLGELPMRKRFHLRVQEGCDNFCTFCIIPFTRGKITSRSSERILHDLEKLSALGYEEVVLTGTHLGGYGLDIGGSLLSLLKKIAQYARSNSGIKRVRLSSLDPDDVSKELIDFVAGEGLFCEHLHLCLQALDDYILKRMNRRHTLFQGLQLLEYTRKRIPAAALGTDLITGFPGESDKLFESQCSVFDSTPLTYVHVFPYSERSGTAATKLDGEVPIEERRRRAARLRALAGLRHREFGRSLVGKNVEVILESIQETEDGDVQIRGTTREFMTALLARSGDNSPQLGRCVELRASKFDERGETLECE